MEEGIPKTERTLERSCARYSARSLSRAEPSFCCTEIQEVQKSTHCQCHELKEPPETDHKNPAEQSFSQETTRKRLWGKGFLGAIFPPFSPFWSPLQSARSGRCEGLEK